MQSAATVWAPIGNICQQLRAHLFSLTSLHGRRRGPRDATARARVAATDPAGGTAGESVGNSFEGTRFLFGQFCARETVGSNCNASASDRCRVAVAATTPRPLRIGEVGRKKCGNAVRRETPRILRNVMLGIGGRGGPLASRQDGELWQAPGDAEAQKRELPS